MVFFTQISFLFSPFLSKQLIFFSYFLRSNYFLRSCYFSFFYRSNIGHCDIWFFLLIFHFYFQLFEVNNSYSSYIYFDLTIFCVDCIFLLITGFKWRVQTHARVFLVVQLNWYVIFMTRFLFLPIFLSFFTFYEQTVHLFLFFLLHLCFGHFLQITEISLTLVIARYHFFT